MKRTALTLLLLILIFSVAAAQVDETYSLAERLERLRYSRGLTFYGKGRFDFSMYNGNGNAFSNVSAVRDNDSTLTLDLGIIAQPFPNVRAGAIIRYQNELSGFYDTGDSISGREVFVEAVLYDFIRVRLGNYYTSFSPFTLGIYEDIREYDNRFLAYEYDYSRYDAYQTDTDRQLEGGEIELGFNSDSVIESMNIHGIASLVDREETSNLYDRFLTGAQITVVQSPILSAGLTTVGLFDVKETGFTNYPAPVKTATYGGMLTFNSIPLISSLGGVMDMLGVELEYNASSFTGTATNATETDILKETYQDYALYGALTASLPELVDISIGYRDVGYSYVAPGAQSAIYDTESTRYDDLALEPAFYEREYYYEPSLARYYGVDLNWTEPMGPATPNRSGVVVDLDAGPGETWGVEGHAAFVNEIRPVSCANKRAFTRLALSGMVDTSKLFSIRFLPKINGIITTENVSRDDDPATITNASGLAYNETEDAQSSLIGAGMEIEVFHNFSVVAEWQQRIIKGTKYVDVYESSDPINITGYEQHIYDRTESLTQVGCIYDFTKHSAIQAYWELYSLNDDYNPVNSHTLDRYKILLVVNF